MPLPTGAHSRSSGARVAHVVKLFSGADDIHLASVDPRVLTEGSQANLHYRNVSAWVPMTLGDVSQRTRALDRGGDGDRFVARDRGGSAIVARAIADARNRRNLGTLARRHRGRARERDARHLLKRAIPDCELPCNGFETRSAAASFRSTRITAAMKLLLYSSIPKRAWRSRSASDSTTCASPSANCRARSRCRNSTIVRRRSHRRPSRPETP